MARSDARRALALARSARDVSHQAGDAEAESTAERAWGLAARELGDVVESERHLKRAVQIAEAAALKDCEGEARMSLCGTLAVRGDPEGALQQADRACAILRGTRRARAQAQRSVVLYDLGRLDEALDGYRRAFPALRKAHDRLWLARLYSNRGLLHVQRGSLAAAEADLKRALELHASMDQHRSVAHVLDHLALVATYRGDIPRALRHFDEADSYWEQAGARDASILQVRCLALLGARLVPEARRLAEEAVRVLAEEGRAGYLAKARLRLAQAALLEADFEVAVREADLARAAFARQGRPAWTAQAHGVAVSAAWLSGERSPALVRSAQRAVRALDEAGFTVHALDARMLLARLALDLGRTRLARAVLAEARAARSAGPVQIRARAWLAEALLRLSEGNRKGADAAVRAGMAVVDRYRATLGATELRALAAENVAELARLGTQLAMEDGRPRRVIEWSERWRAGALRLQPVRPPDDPRLAADLSALRSVVSQLESASSEGRPSDGLRRRQADLEESVRRRARHAKGLLGAASQPPAGIAALLAALAQRDMALVELLELDDHLQAVVLADGAVHLHALGHSAQFAGELDSLRSSLGRLARGRGSAASLDAAARAFDHAARRLDELLMGPLAGEIGDRPLVIVPTSALHALPWGALPSCRERPVVVAPSATLWLRASAGAVIREPVERAVLVAGPRLAHADDEVRTIAELYPDGCLLTGDAATAAAVSSALDGAPLAHVASHGRFRADNPLFSCLELADGPLTVYDVERLERAPRTIVLSACESGLSDVRPGDELMGLASGLLSLGTQTLVASVTAVRDDATQRLMVEFHRRLATGAPAAVALCDARLEVLDDDPRSQSSFAFVCFGAA